MLSLLPRSTGAAAVALQQQTRGMATLKDIRVRLKSVKNIQKITQSMKMVSAAKYARAERELKHARPFGQAAMKFYEAVEVAKPENPKNVLIVAISSDRGLCGAVHSSVAKKIRMWMNDNPTLAPNAKIICVGDKVKAIVQRLYAQNILMTFNDYGKKPPVFDDATAVANAIFESGYEFDSGTLIYNKFKSVVSYETTETPLHTLDMVMNAEKIHAYDSIDAETMRSYHEFNLASTLYYAMKENACSEQSARMTAMDGASKNAGEMIDKLTLTFNRTRQAVITKELIEIISGAAAL